VPRKELESFLPLEALERADLRHFNKITFLGVFADFNMYDVRERHPQAD
jgi:hypothetical protein